MRRRCRVGHSHFGSHIVSRGALLCGASLWQATVPNQALCQRTLREYQERRFATRYAVACRSVGPGANNSVRGWATQGHLVRPKSVPCESVVWFGRCNLLSKGRDSGCASQSAFTGAGLAKRIVNEVDGDFAIADEGSEPLWWWWPDKASVPQSTDTGSFCTLLRSPDFPVDCAH